MSQPLVTAICCTYGRLNRLQNAVAQFIAQDYPNKRMVILNTFPRQRFHVFGPVGSCPIWIVNDKERPGSIGECRNHAIELCDDGILVTWDDDDIYHPKHLSTIAKHFTDGTEWVWLDTMFFCEKDRISRIITGSPNVFAFTKHAWRAVGGYQQVNTGEDRQFITQVMASGLKGTRVKLSPPEITFGYGWDTGDYHLSGHGFDESGQISGYAKVEADVNAAADCGKIPTGLIKLVPKLRFDVEQMMAQWLADNHHTERQTNNDVCIIELGRIGDIVNILPVALHIHNSFAPPYFMVSREFASVLDGVSYVRPLVVDLKQDQVREAVAKAQRRFRHVLVTQVWGQGWQVPKLCASYNRESWRMAGFDHKFDDYSWKPLFDRRDAGREAVLLSRACPHALGCRLLVNVTSGVSSPYPHGAELLAGLAAKFGHIFHVINIATLKLERIYDVLALMEDCAALVSIDTAHLHLSAAVECPTVAICNDKPWLGTEIRHENVLRFTYADSVETILAGMALALGI